MRYVFTGVVVAVVAALGVLVFSDGTAEIAGYVLILLGLIVLALRSRAPSPQAPIADFRYRRAHAERLPPRLVEIERLARFSQTSHVDFDHRLLPRLRLVADDRLLAVYGLTMDESPERAAEILGDPAWSILRPDRRLAADVGIPGPSAAGLESVVSAIESIEQSENAAQKGPQS